MKKRILSLVMVMPFIVMLLAFGFSRTVNLFVDLAPESLEWEYDETEAFEFVPNVWKQGVQLKASVYPAHASNTDIVWAITGGETFDGREHSAENPVARIEGDRLIKIDDGFVYINASIPGTSLSKTFTAYLVDDDGSLSAEPRFVLIKGEDSVESSVKSSYYRYFGMYDIFGGNKVAHTETFSVSVYPSSASQEVTASVAGFGGAAEASVNASENGTTVTVSMKKPTSSFVTLTVASALKPSVSANRFFRIIDGVNVYSYEDLLHCTSEDHPEVTVLRKNLESKSNLSAHKNSALFGREKNGKVECEYSAMESTYDIREYTNEGGKHTREDAKVYVGITFRKSVYGNGYTINAHELTYPSDVMENYDTTIASLAESDLFRGPLDFVRAYNCRCFGQDNIGFLVQGNGIVIDNITLKNCNNVSNLSNLDYVGTVLEVDGDDVTVQYSQIMNGRTVIRSMSNKNLTIEGCMLSYAREFIFKQGSNRFVYAKKGLPDSEISGRSGFNLLAPSEDENGFPLEGQFDSTATIKDSYFHTSGIFCIGMDTHFAGRYLYKFSGDGHVHDMAATSYPSKLSLVGHVRFYDWKTVDGLDSTTLIDLGVSDSGTDYSQLFNISTVMENYFTANPDSNMLLVDENGTNYVHGGVAFYGGGRNLSEVDFSGLSPAEKSLFSDTDKPFKISLDDGGLGLNPILVNAAGYGAFRFYMYDPSKTEITFGSMPFITELSEYVRY